jgi:hypothetical protein
VGVHPRQQALVDWWSIHPAVDWGIAPLAVVFTVWLGSDLPKDVLLAFLAGVAALGGITFAVATFVCGRLYSTAASLAAQIRDVLYPRQTRQTWASVLVGTLASAASSLLSMLVIPSAATIALAVGVASLAMTLTLFVRAAYWLVMLLRAEVIDRRVAPAA